MMWLHDHRAAVGIEQEVSRKRQVAFALEKRLGPIVEEYVADNFIAIPVSVAMQREMPYQEIRPSRVSNGCVAGFCEDVVAQDRYARCGRGTGQLGTLDLMLDFDVVTDRIDNKVILDQAIEKRRRAVRTAEVHPRAGADDDIVSDDPSPRRALGRDCDDVLRMVVIDNSQLLERDVMYRAAGTLRLDAINWNMRAIDSYFANRNVAHIRQAYRVRPRSCEQYRAVA